MFLASGPDLVVEVCRGGLVGSFPSLNQRSSEGFGNWVREIKQRLAETPDAAPFGVNLIVHKSNSRLDADLDIVAAEKVPLVITSLGAVRDVVEAVHSYGGLVFHDVISRRHAEKAAAAGVDGIIGVSAGAGGHAGTINPFALVAEIRSVFGGIIVLAGAIGTGRQIAAARVMGADLAYLGTRFIATREASVSDAYKEMIVNSHAADIVYTPNVSGIHGNFLRPSLVANGLDPDALPPHAWVSAESEATTWKNLWSAGQGVGAIDHIRPAAEVCQQLIAEYRQAMAEAAADQFGS